MKNFLEKAKRKFISGSFSFVFFLQMKDFHFEKDKINLKKKNTQNFSKIKQSKKFIKKKK